MDILKNMKNNYYNIFNIKNVAIWVMDFFQKTICTRGLVIGMGGDG